LAGTKDGQVFQHRLATVTEARLLDGTDFDDAADGVDDHGRQRFAFDFLGEDQRRIAHLGDGFQHRQQHWNLSGQCQLAATVPYSLPVNEAHTRKEKIDRQLARAGWSLDRRRLIEEFQIVAPRRIGEPTDDYVRRAEFAGYVLMDRLNRPIAVIEAKSTTRDALAGERQAADYADAIFAKCGTKPFVFLANGDEIWFRHRDLYPPRRVSGFFPSRL